MCLSPGVLDNDVTVYPLKVLLDVMRINVLLSPPFEQLYYEEWGELYCGESGDAVHSY